MPVDAEYWPGITGRNRLITCNVILQQIKGILINRQYSDPPLFSFTANSLPNFFAALWAKAVSSCQACFTVGHPLYA
jgi:hypothetical protein